VAEVHQLLTLYPELITELGQLREVLALLPPALPEVYPSRQLRSQILKDAQFNLDSESQPSTQIKEFNLTKYLNKTFFVGGIMAILLVGIGFDSYRTRQQLATLKVNYPVTKKRSPLSNNQIIDSSP